MPVKLKGILSVDGRTVEVVPKAGGNGGGSGDVLAPTKKVEVEIPQSQLRTLFSNPISLVPSKPGLVLLPIDYYYMFYPTQTNPTAFFNMRLSVGVLVPGGMQGLPGLGFLSLNPNWGVRALMGGGTYMNGQLVYSRSDNSQPLTDLNLGLWTDKNGPNLEGKMTFQVEYIEYPSS